MKICPQCNEKFDDDISFCLTDGTVLVSESVNEMAGVKPTEETLNETEEMVVNETEAETVIKKDIKAPSKPKGSSGFTKAVLGLLIFSLLFGGIGFAYMQYGKNSFTATQIPNKISKEEMELLVSDFNPMQKKQLSETPEQKKELIDNLKELLAVANQAQKDGVMNDPAIQQELKGMKESVWATSYEQKINKGKPATMPFANVTEAQVKKFWDGTDGMQGILDKVGLGENTKSAREQEFKTYIDNKIALAKKSKQMPEDQQPTEEQLKAARDAFAKIKITYNEAQKKLDSISSMPAAEKKDWENFKKKAELQVNLQTAQFLAQNYFQNNMSKKLEVTDADIDAYIKQHPELNKDEEAKQKADEVMKKVKDGGNFAALAKEYSEDPGSKDKGGLYEGITKGQFDPAFEVAALSLKEGEIAPEPVKTNFGYHIIKLEKKGEAKGPDGKVQESYNVRHILISTMFKDPENPTAREMPAKDYVKGKLEKEKQDNALNEIKKNNPIEIADFEVPKVSDEEIKQMEEEQKKQIEQMQQLQNGQPPMPKAEGDPKVEPNANVNAEPKPKE